ncbi:MAG: hypothetical protein RLZZ292_2731 [Bacteroidota bacterium]|jgi:predicted RNase H-like nuclease (RuvC/YqgF family)
MKEIIAPALLTKILVPTVAIFSGLTLYNTFRGNADLTEARKEVKEIKMQVQIASDSIAIARTRLQVLYEFSEKAKVELGILRSERELIELQQEKSIVTRREELERLKKEIANEKVKLIQLKKAAGKFEL